MDDAERIERRLKLHDIRVLMSVVEVGSMNKAAERLGTSQPAISRAISDLEHALGVSLLDRSPAGVEPTQYGRALIKRGLAVFDELRQGIKDIEFLADPTSGELRIGCSESMADSFVAAVIDDLTRRHPRLSFHIETRVGVVLDQLAMRNIELVISRMPKEPTEKYIVVGKFFDDSFVVAAGPQNRWARRRKIDLVELMNEPWTLPPLGSLGSTFIMEAFQANGLNPPQAVVTAASRTMRNRLLATGRFLTLLPAFSIVPDQYPFLTKLPVRLPDTRASLAVVTLKNRALSPLALLFLQALRGVASNSMGGFSSLQQSG